MRYDEIVSGSQVRCIKPALGLVMNGIYTVFRSRIDGNCTQWLDLEEQNGLPWLASRFVLEAPVIPMTPLFELEEIERAKDLIEGRE